MDSSSETSSEETSSDDCKKDRKRVGRKQGSGMWDLVNEMWPLEARPKLLQKKKVVEKMSIAEISQFKAHYDKEEEKKGGGSAVFGKDKKLKAVVFKKEKDNGTTKLHAARFELRMPLSLPKKYWHKLPAKRDVFRHFPLAHLGMEGQVAETTVVRMHDRRVPITLDMLYKGNAGKEMKAEKGDWLEPTEVRHLQEAVLNYTVLLNAIWPLDYAGFVVSRVLTESGWGLAAGNNEKARVGLVRRFFDEVSRENSGRAVREEPPLAYDEARAKWVKVLEGAFPNLSILGAGPLMTASMASTGQPEPGVASRRVAAAGVVAPMAVAAVPGGRRLGQCAAQRWQAGCRFATVLIRRRVVSGTWRSLMYAKTRRASILRMPATSWTKQLTSSACRRMPGWAAIEGSMCHVKRIYICDNVCQRYWIYLK